MGIVLHIQVGSIIVHTVSLKLPDRGSTGSGLREKNRHILQKKKVKQGVKR